MVASAGSPVGTAGTSTRPRPSRVPPVRREPVPVDDESPPIRARAWAEPRRIRTDAGRSNGRRDEPVPMPMRVPVVGTGVGARRATAARPHVSQ